MRSTAPDTIPHVSVRPNSVTFYNLPERMGARSIRQREAEVHLLDNDHNGHISNKAKSRINQGIDWMLYLANEKTFQGFKSNRKYKFRVNFVTLTLSSKQVHTDQEIKNQLLNQFLIEARVRWKVGMYLWRAEPQNNGRIHFHILTDKFIPYKELKNTWNRIQDKLGYVQRAPDFKKGWNPNSTDVHSVRKVRKLGAYLAKYCTKESKVRKIEGKQWGLSNSLSVMRSATDLRWSDVIDDLSRLWKARGSSLKEYDWHSTYWISVKELKEIGCDCLVGILEDYVKRMSKEKLYICDNSTLKPIDYEISKTRNEEDTRRQAA